eukprot:g22219.t1
MYKLSYLFWKKYPNFPKLLPEPCLAQRGGWHRQRLGLLHARCRARGVPFGGFGVGLRVAFPGGRSQRAVLQCCIDTLVDLRAYRWAEHVHGRRRPQDLAVMCENEQYLQLCRVLLGQERPSLDSLNSAMSGNLVRVMMPCKSVRKLYGPGCSLLHLTGHLAAHPLYRLCTVRALPQVVKGAEAFTSDSWTALQRRNRARMAERRMVQLCEAGSLVDRPSGSPEVRSTRCRAVSASAFLWGDDLSEASLDRGCDRCERFLWKEVSS